LVGTHFHLVVSVWYPLLKMYQSSSNFWKSFSIWSLSGKIINAVNFIHDFYH